MRTYLSLILAFLWSATPSAGRPLITAQRSTAPTRARNQAHVLVPERVAALVRPILDLLAASVRECGEPGSTGSACIEGDAYNHEMERQERVFRMLQELVERKGPSADEALVVLMCFYVGESQEDTDEVISRGRRMLTFLTKYQHAILIIPKRAYPDSILKEASNKEGDFQGAASAIMQGRKGTWDNPEGL